MFKRVHPCADIAQIYAGLSACFTLLCEQVWWTETLAPIMLTAKIVKCLTVPFELPAQDCLVGMCLSLASHNHRLCFIYNAICTTSPTISSLFVHNHTCLHN